MSRGQIKKEVTDFGVRELLQKIWFFMTRPEFKEQIPWFKKIIKKLAYLHENVYSAIRIPGGAITIYASMHLGAAAEILSLAFFSLTDLVDGPVKRYREREKIRRKILKEPIRSRFGAVLDGIADKLFIIPVISYWGYGFIYGYYYFIGTLIFVEFFLNPLLPVLQEKGKINGKRNIYEHIGVGKLKFNVQVLLGVILWIARQVSWDLWPVLVTFLMSLIVILAFLSPFCKAWPVACEKLLKTS